MKIGGRIALAIAGALLFGTLAGWLHGNDGGLRASLGNVSAPWLYVAIIPAWWAGSAVRGAMLGMATTLIALVGFYVSLTATMYGHLGTTHGVVPSFELVLNANRMWFIAGMISGPVCGALASYVGTRARTPWLGVLIGLLMVGEVVAVFALRNVTLPVVQVGWAASDLQIYIPEAVLGVLTVAVVAATGLRPRPERA